MLQKKPVILQQSANEHPEPSLNGETHAERQRLARLAIRSQALNQ